MARDLPEPEQTRERFRDRYGSEPDGIWHAPGRVNLMGEHTDYNEGLVLPIALPWGVRVALARTGDGRVVVHSREYPDAPVSFTPADLADAATEAGPEAGAGGGSAAFDGPGWAAYVAGVFWALRDAGHEVPGARILLESDLAPGAALSSSAALECAVLLAVVEAAGLDRLAGDRQAMALLARRAENDFVGAPTGIMDQSASLRCSHGHALFLDCRTHGARTVALPLEEAGFALLIVDTRTRHALADGGGYAQRRAECERAAAELGVASLRDVEDLGAALGMLGDPVLRRRVQHVVTEIHRVNAAVGLLRAKAVRELGAVFNASHLSLRDQFEVSAPELDLAVEAAVRSGAAGARMTGGGFGGSAIALVSVDRVAGVREGVAAAFAEHGWSAPEFRAAVPSAGAHRVDA